MNYEKIYNDLIKKRRDNPLIKGKDGYTENHHIILESLGGTKDPSNMIRLTAREHFIAHLLLVKFNRCRQTIRAIWFMQTGSKKNKRYDFKKTSRTYAWVREEVIKEMTGKKRPHTEETKKKMSISARNRPPKSLETREKISKAGKGRKQSKEHIKKRIKPHTKETKRKISESNKGKERGPHTEEARLNMSKASKGKPKSDSHKKNISKGHKGMTDLKHSKETKNKISESTSGARNGMYGREHSEESKAKMKETRAKKRRLKEEALRDSNTH